MGFHFKPNLGLKATVYGSNNFAVFIESKFIDQRNAFCKDVKFTTIIKVLIFNFFIQI